MAEKQKKERPMAVCLCKNGKNLRFNASASRLLENWGEADVLEKGDTVAVRSVHGGRYHVFRERERSRVILSNQELVEYLCRKFGCAPGASLPAWTGEQENTVFFGGAQDAGEPYALDGGWTPLVLEYNRRAGDWAYVHDDWIEFSREVRYSLPASMSPFQCGGAVALMADPKGRLKPEPRRKARNNMLVSHGLAQELRKRYGGVPKGLRLRAALIPGGILLAGDEDALNAADRNRMEPLPLGEMEKRYLRMQEDGGIYLSSRAKAALGAPDRLSIRRRGGAWTVVGEKTGGLKVFTSGCANYVFSKALVSALAETWPGVTRLYLLEQEGDFRLWPEAEPPQKRTDVPPRRAGENACYIPARRGAPPSPWP